MHMSQHIGRTRPHSHISAQKAIRTVRNVRALSAAVQGMRSQHESDVDKSLVKAALLRRVDLVQAEAANLVARSKACKKRYQTVSQLVSKVLVQERKRLIATEQTYMRSEDTMREQVCLAEHNADLGQAVTSQGFATLQAAVQSAGTSQATAVRMLVETISAEVDRVRVHIRTMKQRRLQMSWALSRQGTEEVQQLRSALKQPGLLQAEVEEQAYALVLQQLQDIQKCNKQMSASTIKHAATRTYKDKRRAHLIKALHTTTDAQQQQQHLEGYMTQTQQRELINKAASLAADSAAQQLEQQRLRAVLDAYEQLRLVHTQELALNTTAAEEEVALVFDFLEKMACQMSETECMLTALLQELHAQTHEAQDMLAAEQQGQ